ncbi:MAG TPA: hypothetical protein VN922_10365, partial [Bacteroidia bacterium]|nr:hypothetical protein [Bacteroidia bacterium]
GNLYVADKNNNMIREILSGGGTVSTFAGNIGGGSTNGIGTAASFNFPEGIATDGYGNLFVADSNNEIRQIVLSTASVTTLAGSLSFGHADGALTAATFYAPSGIAIVVTGGNANLYVADKNNNEIRKVSTPCSIAPTTSVLNNVYCYGGNNAKGIANISGPAAPPLTYSWAPVGGTGDSILGVPTGTYTVTVTDHNGCPGTASITFTQPSSALAATVNASPSSICAGGTSTISATVSGGTSPYSYMWNNGLTATSINVGSSQLTVSTIAGSINSGYSDGTGSSASFYQPAGITSDGPNLYVADEHNMEIRKINVASGAVTTLAGFSAGDVDGTGTTAKFQYPSGIVYDGSGNLYVADNWNHKIRKVVIATGVVTTLAGTGGIGSADGIGTAASFNYPSDVALDGAGNLYVADYDNNEIRKVVIATGAVTTFAGSTTSGTTDGTGTSARFNQPEGLACDGTNLYVSDYTNNRIRQIVLSTGVVTTLAGSTNGYTDGTGTSAQFYLPEGLATDGHGDLYVGDFSNNRIRKVVISTGGVTTLAGSTQGSANGIDSSATFYNPDGMYVDGGGNIFLADYNNNQIRKIVPYNNYS